MDHTSTCEIETMNLFEKRKSSGPIVRQNDFCHDTEITIHKK